MGEENNTVAPTDYDTLRERLREPVWEHAEAVAKMTEAAEAITQLQAKVERLEKAAFEQRILTQAEARTAAAAPTDAGALVDELEEAIHRWSPERFTEIRARHMGDSTLITPRFTADTLAIVEDAAPTFEAFADLVVLAVNSLPRILTALRASTGTPAEGEGEKR